MRIKLDSVEDICKDARSYFCCSAGTRSELGQANACSLIHLTSLQTGVIIAQIERNKDGIEYNSPTKP